MKVQYIRMHWMHCEQSRTVVFLGADLADPSALLSAQHRKI